MNCTPVLGNVLVDLFLYVKRQVSNPAAAAKHDLNTRAKLQRSESGKFLPAGCERWRAEFDLPGVKRRPLEIYDNISRM